MSPAFTSDTYAVFVYSSLDPDEHVDIDTYTEEEGQSLAQTLQWEAVSNPSPADSNSTTGTQLITH